MKTVAIYSSKGGVGKSTAAVNLAHRAAMSGISTLLWDMDAQGASSWYLHGDPRRGGARKVLAGDTPVAEYIQATPYDRLSLVPAAFSMRGADILLRKAKPAGRALKRALKPLGRDYSLAILDCPPTLSHLADNIFAAVDVVMVPVIPTHLSLRAYEQLLEYFESQGQSVQKLRPFFSMVDRRRSLHRQMLQDPPAMLRQLCASVVPYASAIERMGAQGQPVAAYAPPSDPSVLAYRALWDELAAALDIGDARR